ncbi:MAG TPA: hypothetical protein PLZ86_08550 [bacterium]|nr:hypothetical protein [bacterium]
MENKWLPCMCTVVLGILVIVFAWVSVSWGNIALTIIGAAVILRGLINKCCCGDAFKKEGGGC